MTTTIETADLEARNIELPAEGEVGYSLSTLEIRGVPHHVEMIEVNRCKDPDCLGDMDIEQDSAAHWCDKNSTVDPGRQDQVETLYDALGCDGAWRCVVIDGRDYLVIISPFCD